MVFQISRANPEKLGKFTDFLFLHPAAGGETVQIAFDEGIQRAVHDCIYVGGLTAGAGVLDQRIGHEHVVADLAAPLDLLLNTLDVGNLVQMLPLFDFHQLAAQHPKASLLVLELAPLRLAGNHNAGGLVNQTDCGGGLIDVLAACAGGTVDLHFVVLGTNLHVLAVIFDVRNDFHGGKGGLAAGVGIKGRDPHQTVDAVLPLQEAVGVLALDHNGSGFQAGLIALLIVHNLVGEAVAFRPAGIHPVEHLAPVLGFGAAGTGLEAHHGIVLVIMAGEQGF